MKLGRACDVEERNVGILESWAFGNLEFGLMIGRSIQERASYPLFIYSNLPSIQNSILLLDQSPMVNRTLLC